MSYSRRFKVIKKAIYKKSKPSLNGIDEKLSKYLDFDQGFFIEAGANDGHTQSNTYYLENKLGWQGLLVEGIPELFKKCKKLRKNSVVKNCALVSTEFEETAVTMHYANLMSVVEGALKNERDQCKHISAGVDVQKLEGSYSVQVPARTLGSLLDELPAPADIDFFSLDVEGYELQVLQGLNIAKHRPKFILVEARFFEEVNSFLISNHYAMLEQLSYHDYLYRDMS